VYGVVEARFVRVDNDGLAGKDHLQVHGGPTSVVAIRHIETGDDNGKIPLPRSITGHSFSRNLADAVSRHEDVVAVPQGVTLFEGIVSIELIDPCRGAMQKCFGMTAVAHQQAEPFDDR